MLSNSNLHTIKHSPKGILYSCKNQGGSSLYMDKKRAPGYTTNCIFLKSHITGHTAWYLLFIKVRRLQWTWTGVGEKLLNAVIARFFNHINTQSKLKRNKIKTKQNWSQILIHT